MCNCIEDIQDKQLESKSISTGNNVKSFWFTDDSVGVFLNIRTGKEGMKTKSTIKYTLEGQNKVHTSFMRHKFCPFCGKKY